MARLTAAATERAEALTAIAIAEGLAETRGYLHSSVGLKPDGTVVLLMMHGSLQEIGRAHRDIGSYRAVLLDNGGSVGVARYTQRGWRQGSGDEGWGSSGARPTPEHVFGNGTYFRPRGHSVFVVELTGDIVEDPFLLLPPGDAAWGRPTDG